MFQNAAPELEKCIGQARRAEGIKPGVQRIETPGGHELVIKQAPERGDGPEGRSEGVPRISATPDGVRILPIKSRSSLRSLRALFRRASGAGSFCSRFAVRSTGRDAAITLRISKRLQTKQRKRLCLFAGNLCLHHPAANVEVTLREGNLDPGLPQFFFDREIEVALESAGAMAHLATPDHQLKIDRAFAELVQENARSRIFQDVGIAAAGGNERFTDFVDVAAV